LIEVDEVWSIINAPRIASGGPFSADSARGPTEGQTRQPY
jgi:hypothetical protein